MNEDVATTPLLIGGETPAGCELLGALLGTLPQVAFARSSRLLCQPALWGSPRDVEDWGEDVATLLFPPVARPQARPDIARLRWCVPEAATLTDNLLTESRIREILLAAADGRELIDRLTAPALAIRDARHWLDHTPENLYTMAAVLAAFPEARGIHLVRDGRAAVLDRMRQGHSPKGAAGIWLVETAIGQQLQDDHTADGRVLTVRLEDLLAEPDRVLPGILAHCRLPADAIPPGDPANWFAPGTPSADSDLTDRLTGLRTSLRDWREELAERYEHYLCGLVPDIEQLSRRGFRAADASGAQLLARLAYPAPRREPEKATLSPKEQTLGHEQARFVNPLVHYRSPQAADSHEAESGRHGLTDWLGDIRSHSFHPNRHPLHYLFCLKCWYRWWRRLLASPAESPATSSATSSAGRADDVAGDSAAESGAPIPDGDPATPEAAATTPGSPTTALRPTDADLAVVIAFAGRHRILRLVVEELFRAAAADWKLEVILVCSDADDESFVAGLRERLTTVHLCSHPNQPLGAKWQAGVDAARELRPRNLMILGSDDVLSPRFLAHALPLMRGADGRPGFDMVTPSSWHLYDCDPASSFAGSLWELSYRDHQPVPLGAGRVYSAAILARFAWRLFHRHLRNGLDSRGFQQVLAHRGNVYRLPQALGTVLSVKGDWNNLNSTTKILHVADIRSRPLDFAKGEFFAENFSFSEEQLRDRLAGD